MDNNGEYWGGMHLLNISKCYKMVLYGPLWSLYVLICPYMPSSSLIIPSLSLLQLQHVSTELPEVDMGSMKQVFNLAEYS